MRTYTILTILLGLLVSMSCFADHYDDLMSDQGDEWSVELSDTQAEAFEHAVFMVYNATLPISGFSTMDCELADENSNVGVETPQDCEHVDNSCADDSDDGDI